MTGVIQFIVPGNVFRKLISYLFKLNKSFYKLNIFQFKMILGSIQVENLFYFLRNKIARFRYGFSWRPIRPPQWQERTTCPASEKFWTTSSYPAWQIDTGIVSLLQCYAHPLT